MPVASIQQVAREAFARRDTAGGALARDAELITRAARDMAARFRRGGKLVVFGNGGAGTDAAHVAVEFMHPVIVGKPALPALALSNDAATVSAVGADEGMTEAFAHQVRHWADPGDVALGISRDDRAAAVRRGLETARELGLLTVALTGDRQAPPTHPENPVHAANTGNTGNTGNAAEAVQAAAGRAGHADHVIAVASADPAVIKEIHVTTYHLLWELVHVFLEQGGEALT
ncbi:D-sedoheptulose-7-phosphate isomerase [Planotetraspora kaengkrachanensis]|uniref:Phosphoheptose isomerase n=1 Tax=Planotetraspora kaengkrachanensis TaxID=575193 RepID=A0A8J3PZ21_9ACTN|nr:SIS domain-containing protein [Planotetraspora kaengkrachanensis]GIG83541.1 phosphoheptose isomerase [Planotetraspora kaengkrachanensis]